MEEKKKGVLRFFKLSAGRHKREAAPGTGSKRQKGKKEMGKAPGNPADNRSSRSRGHDL